MSYSTIAEAFDELLKRIELNPARVDLASQRYNAVKATVERELPGKAVSQIGSFQRKTKIRPADLSDGLDIDVVVSFKRFTQYATDGSGVSPAGTLETVRRAVTSNETYRVMAPEIDHPVVTLQYADDMKIELIPAFVDCTGDHPHPGTLHECYVIGTASGAWIPADYDYDAAMISALNARTKMRLVPCIKLAKAYFRNVHMPLKSFHTELLAATTVPDIIAEWDGKSYRYGYEFLLAEFLRRAANSLTTPVQLAGSFSPPINSDLTQLRLASLGTWLKGRSDEAWKLAQVKDVKQALVGWRAFFGEPFPS